MRSSKQRKASAVYWDVRCIKPTMMLTNHFAALQEEDAPEFEDPPGLMRYDVYKPGKLKQPKVTVHQPLHGCVSTEAPR